MASSPIFFGGYAPQAASGGSARLQAQLRTWLPVLAFTLVFAVESTPWLGADHTSAPLQRLVEAIFGYDVCVHWDLIHFFIRKGGHFLGYGVFSLICFRAFWMEFPCAASRMMRKLRAHGLAILATFIVAGADEFHQSFLPNRTGEFSDVLLDCCGAAVLGMLLFLAMKIVEGRRLARASQGCRLQLSYARAAAYGRSE